MRVILWRAEIHLCSPATFCFVSLLVQSRYCFGFVCFLYGHYDSLRCFFSPVAAKLQIHFNLVNL